MNPILVTPFPRPRGVFKVLHLPFLARLYYYIYHQPSASRVQMRFKQILRKLFPVIRRFSHAKGKFEYQRQGKSIPILFNARNVQFHALYASPNGFEPDVSGVLDALLPEGGTFFDIGSNWGYFSLYTASKYSRLTVHAFEPMPETYQDLANCVKQAGLSDLVTCHNLALSDADGNASIDMTDGVHSGTATVSRKGGSIKIVTRRMDSLKLPKPDFIKMDVEYHELEVLKGAKEMLTAARPHIVFENKAENIQPENALEVLFFLSELGYKLYVPAVQRRQARSYFMIPWWHPIGDGENLALIPLKPEERPLLSDLNIFACHESRQHELLTVFKTWP